MRSFLRWFFFLLALGVVASLITLSSASKNLTPRDHFEAGRRYAFGPDRDADMAFRHLDFALRGAEAADNLELSVEVLKARGRLFTSLGSLPRARQDYEEVLLRYRPDDLESQLALASVLLELGEDGEASRRIDAVLGSTPDSGPALAVRAELDLRYARAALTEARRLIDLSLPPSERDGAIDLLVRAASLPAEATRRLRLVDGLRQSFPTNDERLLQSVLECLETATLRHDGARAALVASFADGATTTTLDAYLELLARSGRTPLALEFALAALKHPNVKASPGFLERTAQLLEVNRQPHLALEVIAAHLGGNMPGPDFYQRWCKLLYGEQRWDDLVIVATAFAEAGNATQRPQGFGYVGLAKVELGQFEEAQKALRPFLSREPPEPFPGAIALGWQQLARCYREAGRDVEEAGALRMAAAKGRGTLRDEGELWLRLYELGAADPVQVRSLPELERILTYALSLLPERVEEYLPKWHDLGRRNLDAANVDLRAVFDEMLQTQNFKPPSSAGPYETFELAQLFAARELHPGVLQHCNSILVHYPGFRPAEELALAARRALQDTAGIARMLQSRLARSGPDPEVVAAIEALGPEVIDPDQRLNLMRADPGGFARRHMLEALAASGDTAVMVDALLALPDEQLSDDDRIRAGSLLLELGHGSELGVVLDALGDDPALQARATGLRLRAALAASDWEAFDRELAALQACESSDAPALLTSLDLLLALGQSERALALGLWLDEQPALRTPLVVLRASQAARRLGNRPASAEGLVRADAALSDGAPELGYLLDAVSERDWGRLPERVTDLRASGFTPGDLASALLDILEEDFAGAAERVAAGTSRQPGEPLWMLARAALAELMTVELGPKVLPGDSPEIDHQTVLAVRGPEGRERDPREVLVLVLATEHEHWRDWALAECAAQREPDSAALWLGYAAGRAWLRRGDADFARERAEVLTAGWPEFAAGWDLLEAADRALQQRLEGRPVSTPVDEPSLVRWRQREVLGAMPGDPALEHWMASLEAERKSERDVALSAVGRAVDLSPADVRFRLTQARLYALGRDWLPALTSMDHAIRVADGESRLTVAERALELHRRILFETPAASLIELVRDQRERLELRFPNDPLVSVDLARSDLSNWTSTPDRGLSKALRRLDRLRVRTDGMSLEDLRRGSTRLWFEFLLEYDGRAALRFALEELRLRPATADLWRMLAEANESLGARDGAIELRGFLQSSLPDAADARALVRLLALSGSDLDAFERAFTGCLVQEDLLEPDADLLLERARFQVESGPEAWPAALALLEGLWLEHAVPHLLPPPESPPVVEGELAAPGLLPLEGEPALELPVGPWQPGTTPVDIARTQRIGQLYARLLAWMGRPEDAPRLDELTELLELVDDDRLAREVRAALRALAPRPPPAEPRD